MNKKGAWWGGGSQDPLGALKWGQIPPAWLLILLS